MNDSILIVDDSAFMRGIIRNTLKQVGYNEIYEAADGPQAIEAVGFHHPSVVTLDITMPGMSGLDTLAHIKSLYPDIRVVMCSSMGQSSHVKEAIRLGASDFIVKPFEPTQMVSIITKNLVHK